MVKKILTALAVISLLFIAVVAIQPSEFRVSRTVVISAPVLTVFPQVNDFRNWEAWSPWAKLDPVMKKTYEGERSGVGAVYAWAGNKNVGEGRTTIIESRPGELVKIRLEFMKPFKAVNISEFTFKAEGSQTTVTWSMYGTNNFLGKAVGLIMNCDKMVGGQFEQGLAQLKLVTESLAQAS